MNFFYYILTHVCYAIGHPLSVLTNFVAKHSEDENGLIDTLHTSSSKFLLWSSDFDKAEWLWLHRHNDETQEQFEQRCKTRWPDTEK